jgi:hydrogenase maturation protein HypF
MLERVASLMETDTQQEVAAAFHHMLSASIADACRQLAEEHGINRVCLSGGVFQNELILHLLVEALKSMKLLPYFHRQVPPNDGGLALGQMVVGASVLGFAEIS